MSDTLFDISQYQSQSNMSESPDLRDATGTDSAWEQPDLEPDLGTNPQGPVDDALIGWRTEAEFTLTLQSGQTVEVTFVPCLVGKRRMHEFSFTGPVSSTGFKSHFVLAVEAEEYPHPCDYAQAYIHDLVARFEAAQQQQAKSKKRARRPVAEVETAQERTAGDNNFRQEPAMAENETTDSSHAKVDVVEELSPEEEADRQRLELKVERAFFEAGCSLRELRDRRLYRSTHKSWEEYCQGRFGFTRHAANFKIAASGVFENLVTKSYHPDDVETADKEMVTKSYQILPTKETQVRPLAKLDPEEQSLVWQQAVETAGGKVPSERIVKDAVLRHKGIVERLKEKNPSPPEFVLGDVVEIKAAKRSPLHPFNGMWAIIEHIGSFSYTVRISIARDTQQCKKEEVTLIDEEYTADIKAVAQRIKRLVELDLEPVDFWILEGLQRSICFTPRQLLYLERMEADYRLATDDN